MGKVTVYARLKTDPNGSHRQNKVENKKNIKITNGCT
jgi:hypothetical protein